MTDKKGEVITGNIILGNWLYLSPNILINTDNFDIEISGVVKEEHKTGDIRFIDEIDLHLVSLTKK